MLEIKKSYFSFPKVLFFSWILVLSSSLFLNIFYHVNKDLNLLLFSVVLALIANILLASVNIKKMYLFLIFNFMLFVFIASRCTIDYIKLGDLWQTRFKTTNLDFSLSLLFYSLIALGMGAGIATKTIKTKSYKLTAKKQHYRRVLQDIALIGFYVAVIFAFIVEFERFMYIRNVTYLEYISNFKSSLPNIVNELASTTTTLLCIFLSTFPSKRKAFIPLMMNVILKVPTLLAGTRNPIVLAIVFMGSYYLIMEYKEDGKKWIGKLDKRLVIIFTPISIVLLGAMNYLRAGSSVRLNIFELIVDFFYKQGVTFDIINYSYNVLNYLPNKAEKMYTFGIIVDYIRHGIIGRILWNSPGLGPAGNTILMGTKSNLLAHNLSYTLYGNFYLEGHGVGSSYLLETYIDWGYIGTIIFSILLGVFLVYLTSKVYNGGIVTVILLISLTKLFLIPRAGALEWIDFLLTVRFWTIIGTFYLLAYLIHIIQYKQYNNIQNLKSEG